MRAHFGTILYAANGNGLQYIFLRERNGSISVMRNGVVWSTRMKKFFKQ